MKNQYELSDNGKYYRIYFIDKSFFLIDSDDFKLVSVYTWSKGKRGYPIAHKSRKSEDGNKTFTLHRYLYDFPIHCDIDHIDGNKMDNRRFNLRICSHQQNTFNQKLRKTNTSGYYGVSKHKSANLYEAYIHYNGKKKYLGLYSTAEEAAVVRDNEAIRLFGEYAKLNFAT